MRKLYPRLINWLENGDLIPWVIGVSVPHYVTVLAEYEFVIVAAILGFLIDLAHYRTIRTFRKGQGWFWMFVLSIVSYGFHVAFYLSSAGWASWAIGAVPTIIIFALSALSVNEGWANKARRKLSETERKAAAVNDGTKRKVNWKQVTGAERSEIAGMPTNEIEQMYNVSDRTARNWRRWSQEAQSTKSVDMHPKETSGDGGVGDG